MEIYVLGSGAVSARSGYPGYLVDGTILVDCPPGTVKKLYRRGIDPCAVTDVLVTHFHADHYFDLPRPSPSTVPRRGGGSFPSS